MNGPVPPARGGRPKKKKNQGRFPPSSIRTGDWIGSDWTVPFKVDSGFYGYTIGPFSPDCHG